MFYKSNQVGICIVEEEKIAHVKLVQSVSIKDKEENAEVEDDRNSDIMLLKYEEEIRLQKMKEQLINAKWRDEMLKENEYQEKDLETETSNETKESQCFEIKIFCMFASEKNKGERQNLNSALEGNGTTESHIYAHAQLGKSNGF